MPNKKSSFKVVLDASVVAKFLVKEKDSEKAASLFEQLSKQNIPIFEPNFLKIEIYSVVRKKLFLKEISQKDTKQVLSLFEKLEFEYVFEEKKLLDLSFKLTNKLKQPVIYDCLYLALAKEKKAIFITADLKFLKLAKKNYRHSFSLNQSY